MPRKFLVAANHKMNGSAESVKKIVTVLNNANLDPNVQVVVAPPTIYLIITRDSLRKDVQVAAQNVYDKPEGAYTGEVAVSQLVDSNVHWVILGHSERRQLLNETNEFVASKTKAAINGGIGVILCCGESLEERKSGQTIAVVEKQLKAVVDVVPNWSDIVVAYEPIWAIGTGVVATTEQAQEVHAAIRKFLAKELSPEVAESTRCIYGGSVNEKNCKELAKQPDIDGFLVGGASLKPAFVEIVNAKLS